MSEDGTFVFGCPPPVRYFEHSGENHHDVLSLSKGELLWRCFCGRPRIKADGLDFTPEYE